MSQERKRLFSRENIAYFAMGVVTLALAIIADNRGMPHKWHTAIFGTVVPFTCIVISLPSRWRQWSFWVALTICLAVHIIAMWFFFQYVLVSAQGIGLLLWFPIAVIELVVLLVAVKRIAERLDGKKETWVILD